MIATTMRRLADMAGFFGGLEQGLAGLGWAAAAPGVISEAGKDAVTSPVAGATKLTAGALGSNTVGSIYDVQITY